MRIKDTCYILDTNVFLRNPDCIYSFPGAHIIIPLSVIEELDHFKGKVSEIGRNARLTLEVIEKIRALGSLHDGIKLENGAVLFTKVYPHKSDKLPDYLDMGKNTNRVLSTVLQICDDKQWHKENVVLVTNDYSLKIRAGAFNICVESLDGGEKDIETIYDTISEIEINAEDYDFLIKNQALKINEAVHPLHANMHILLKHQNEKAFLCRYIKRNHVAKMINPNKNGVWEVYPKNTEQLASLDLLTDSSIDIVVLAGKAGTGKTLLALAAALDQLYKGDVYTRILVSRPIIPMGRELGYLPGDLNDKIAPWMQPIFDNLEYLHTRTASKSGKFGDYHSLIEKNLIEIEALSYIRGRSIPNRFMIVDEAQNLTPHEIKTIVTRAGEGTKIVLTGDPYQIDNAYLDSTSNGLTYVIEKLKDIELAGHVFLKKGERSKLAELASNLL